MKADPRLKSGPGQDAEALMLLQGSSEQHSSQEETPQTTWEYFIYKERDEKRLLSWGEAGFIRGMREWEIQIFALSISEGRTLGRALITKPIYSLGSGGSRSSPGLLSSSSNNVHTLKAPWRRKTIQETPHHGHTHPDLQIHPGSGLRGWKQLAVHAFGMLVTVLQSARE